MLNKMVRYSITLSMLAFLGALIVFGISNRNNDNEVIDNHSTVYVTDENENTDIAAYFKLATK